MNRSFSRKGFVERVGFIRKECGIASPLCIAIAAILCGLSGEKLSMLTMAFALPPAFSGIIIGSRYNVYVQDGASILAVSTLMFAFAAPFWIWFCPILQSWL